ncbi:MAG: LacI family DNA-binding transcriptional regulator [Spirochaetales bacterium]|nr:LacI family DNA-binding transcriptional regulator [Spirochaetales bacterium]
MATLKDIAKELNVNISTVSRALNDSNEVGDETKKLVQETAKRLHYVPNLSARALVGKSTKLVGVIVPEIRSNHYVRVINHIETELKKHHYSFIFGKTNFKPENDIYYLNLFSQRKVDGIIIAGPVFKNIKKTFDEIQSIYHRPILVMEAYIEYPNYDYVQIDNEYGIEEAVRHLVSKGIRVFGYVGDKLSSTMRVPYFKEALASNSLSLKKEFIKIGSERFELGGYMRMKELLGQKKLPEAVFASYDHMALGAMKAIHEAGLKIPKDISIFGYDNINESEYMYKSLTTIAPPIEEMTKIGISTLIEKIENDGEKTIRHISLKPKLIVRESTI